MGISDMATVKAPIFCEEAQKAAGRTATPRLFLLEVAKSLMQPWCVMRLCNRSLRRSTQELIKPLWGVEDAVPQSDAGSMGSFVQQLLFAYFGLVMNQ